MAQIVYGVRHFVEYVTCLAVSRETPALTGVNQTDTKNYFWNVFCFVTNQKKSNHKIKKNKQAKNNSSVLEGTAVTTHNSI